MEEEMRLNLKSTWQKDDCLICAKNKSVYQVEHGTYHFRVCRSLSCIRKAEESIKMSLNLVKREVDKKCI